MNSLSLTEYAQVLTKNGRRNLPGAPGTCWIRDDSLAMVRFPFFSLAEPSHHELSQVLWKSPAALASYHFRPDERHPANALLYVCRDRAYALEKLSSNMRRDIRRGLRELRIERITADQLIAAGARRFEIPTADMVCRSPRAKSSGKSPFGRDGPARFFSVRGEMISWRHTCPSLK